MFDTDDEVSTSTRRTIRFIGDNIRIYNVTIFCDDSSSFRNNDNDNTTNALLDVEWQQRYVFSRSMSRQFVYQHFASV